MQGHAVLLQSHGFFPGVIHFPAKMAEGEVFPRIKRRKGQRSTGVFLLTLTEEVGGIADLGFDFLFAIAVVAVGDQSDAHA